MKYCRPSGFSDHLNVVGFLSHSRPCEASLRAFEMLPPSSPPLDDILTQTSQRDMSSTQIFRTNCEYFKNLRKDVSSEFLNRPLELSSLERTPVVDISPSGEFTKKPAFPRTRPNYLQTMPLSSNEDTNYKDEDLFQDSSELFTSQCEQRFGSVRESFSRADFANSGDGEGTGIYCSKVSFSFFFCSVGVRGREKN